MRRKIIVISEWLIYFGPWKINFLTFLKNFLTLLLCHKFSSPKAVSLFHSIMNPTVWNMCSVTCSEVNDDIDEEDGIGETIEDDSTDGKIVVEKWNSYRKNN